jgi:hypothetical protein
MFKFTIGIFVGFVLGMYLTYLPEDIKFCRKIIDKADHVGEKYIRSYKQVLEHSCMPEKKDGSTF